MARMPVLKHYHGVCHAYVHASADWEMAADIILNSKCQKPGVCNALESLLIDREIVEGFVPMMAELLRAKGVKIFADDETRKFWTGAEAATEGSWSTEYLDLALSVKTVANLDEAIGHINHYGSHHTDVIITSNEVAAKAFLHEVDSAVVMWNASTRFNDGGEFGFGAEIGISTDKLHARGPMALEELTTYKYVIWGRGQVRK